MLRQEGIIQCTGTRIETVLASWYINVSPIGLHIGQLGESITWKYPSAVASVFFSSALRDTTSVNLAVLY